MQSEVRQGSDLAASRARSALLRLLASAAAASALAVLTPAAGAAEPQHAIAMHGTPALPSDFAHLPYADPKAPKGGTLRLGELGSFDSLNPFILKGVAASGMREYVFESLLARSADEPFTLYAHVARGVEMPDDRRSVTFHLDPAARFADGRAITAEDVVFSWRLLKEKGQPYHRAHYGGVARAEIPRPGVVHFDFEDHGNREAPLLLGLMPILPAHRLDPATFEQTSLEPPLGSGPYKVAAIDAGRSIAFARNPDWWARDKPIFRGRYNFDRIQVEYFRDQTTLFEAFKSGDIDVRFEDDAGRWAEGYDFPAVQAAEVLKAEIPLALPAGMTALVLNSRRPQLADRRVRRALGLLFDFEWINRSFFHGHYRRTQSFFERSELASTGRPADAVERMLLAPQIAAMPAAILEGTYRQPVSDGSGRNRENMRAALALLHSAGFVQDGGRLVDARTRQPLAIEMMAAKRSEERLFQAYAKSLAQLGIAASVRSVDSAQRWARLKSYDFDVIQWTWGASLSPGNEQRNRWGSESYDAQNALNFAGVRDPAVDATIEALLAARERPGFIAAVRALDRLLLAGEYVVPLYHPPGVWLAWRKQYQRPARPLLSGVALDTWWAAN